MANQQSQEKAPRLLVVEDELLVMNVLVGLLEQETLYDIESSNDGIEALERCSKQHYDLIVTDLNMPLMDGQTLIREIRKINTDVAIIVLTGYGDLSDAYSLLDNYQISDYLYKPVSRDALLFSVKNALEKNKLQHTVPKYTPETGHVIFDDNEEVIKYLKESRLFSPLPDEMIQQLVPLSTFVYYAPGTEILKEGYRNDKVYFLIRGVVGIYSGEDLILKLRRNGDIFGEMSVISDKACTATVIAENHVNLFCLDSKYVGKYMDINTDSLRDTLYQMFAMVLTEKLTFTTHKAKEYERTNKLLAEAKSELETTHDELREAYEQVESKMRALENTQAQLVQSAKLASIGQLATGIAHELNQPIGYIRNNAQTAIMDGEENLSVAQAFKALKQVEEGTTRMMRIINHLRSFGRQTDFGQHPLDLHEVMENSLILFNEQLKLLNIQVVKNYASYLPRIRGNAQELEQVFINLVSNAQDALEGKENATLTIKTEFRLRDDDFCEVLILFMDNGCGIPQDVLDKIFDPFFTTKKVGEGTGLGLSISYGIVQEHRGQIQATSVVGEGTTFTLVFPAYDHTERHFRGANKK